MNTTAHTPTPWRCDPVKEGTLNIMTGEQSKLRDVGHSITAIEPKMFGGTRLIEKGLKPADAAFIVEACNAHDSLKAQNAELVKALRDLHVTLTGPGTRNDRISGAVVFIAVALAGVQS